MWFLAAGIHNSEIRESVHVIKMVVALNAMSTMTKWIFFVIRAQGRHKSCEI